MGGAPPQEALISQVIENGITSLGKFNIRDVILPIVLIFVEKIKRRHCQRGDF